MTAIALLAIATATLIGGGVVLVLRDERRCELCGGRCREAYHTDEWQRIRNTPVPDRK
jgi:hypothetical protein